MVHEQEMIIILDFGAQYTHLIARRIRAAHFYCEILPYNTGLSVIKEKNPKGIVLSGGPASVLEEGAPRCELGIFELGVPILGICYGMQLMAQMLGGKVIVPDNREYGKVSVSIDDKSSLLLGLDDEIQAWMSHTLQVSCAPEGFRPLAHTEHCDWAAFSCEEKQLYGLQFHPEVTHTEGGENIICNFLTNICRCKGNWHMSSFVNQAVKEIQSQVGDGEVLLGLSGGVDSSVTAALLHRAIGDKLTAVFVDHGLMRKNEPNEVEAVFRPIMGEKLKMVDASNYFLSKLAGVTEPEQKRKIIGAEFISVFADAARSLGRLDYLAQGTIYPDIVESCSATGTVIKSHHNVGGMPDDLPFIGVVEPLRPLFKDEVRTLGEELGLPKSMVWRQPFPGPGLAVRVVGEITREKLEIARESDSVFREEMKKAGLDEVASQYFTVLTGLRSVGVMGDERSYDYTLALRAISTDDFMTADWVRIPYEVLDIVARRIVNEVRNVNRVVYDITTKPPASVEWE